MAFGSCVLNDVIADLHPSNHDEDDMKRELFKISAVIFSIKRTGAPVSTGPDESAAELTRAVNVGVRGVSLLSPSVTEKRPSCCYRQWTEGCPDSSFTTRLTSTHVQLKMSELSINMSRTFQKKRGTRVKNQVESCNNQRSTDREDKHTNSTGR